MNLNKFNNVLISYWNFDEISGDRTDCVGSHNLLTVGNTLSNTGINNNSAYFNGDSLLYTNHSNYFGDVSSPMGFLFSTWVYFDKNSTIYNNVSNSIIAEKLPYFSISTQNLTYDRQWQAKVSDITINTSNIPLATTNVWYHILLGVSNSILFFSVRPVGGNISYSTSTYATLLSQNTPLYIGKSMKGRIDETSFWYNPDITSLDEFIDIANTIYNNGTGLFYNCSKDLWEESVVVNTLTSKIPSEITPNTNEINALKEVITYIIKDGVEIEINDSSKNRSTLNSFDANSLSFGTIAPGDYGTEIIKLRVPNAVVIKNIKIGLIECNIPIENIFITTNTIIDHYMEISDNFAGYTDGKDSENNYIIENLTRNSSYYVYIRVLGDLLGSSIIKFCWYFDYA